VPQALTRRNFFGASRPRIAVIRPPGAIVEDLFVARCDACAACAHACPQGIISLENGLPRLDFGRGEGECLFCDDCTNACPTGALSLEQARPWHWAAEIGATCLSLQRITCRACADSCEPRAIRFRPVGSGRDIPLIDESTCTGCGACSSVCPVGAVRFHQTTLAIAETVA